MELEFEKKFKCPYCLAPISMLFDLSENGQQIYIEDCEVCCRPIQVRFMVHNHKIESFAREAIQ